MAYVAGKLSKSLRLLWQIVFSLAALGGWFALLWLLSSPSEAESARFFTYSIGRVILAAFVLLPTLLFTFLSIRIWRNEPWLKRRTLRLEALLRNSITFWALLFGCLFLLTFSWVLFFLPQGRAAQLIGSYSLYLLPLKPVIFYAMLLGSLASPMLLIQRYGLQTKILVGERATLALGLSVFLLFLFVWGLITATGLGLGFDATIWNAPGAPILANQVLLCLLVAPLILLAVLSLRGRYLKNGSSFNVDLSLAFLVWIVAAFLWLHQPAVPTYYSSKPQPPNYDSYPLSDAFNHDVIANNVLIGEGFRLGGNVAIRRPVYVQFLTGLEALLGSHYDRVVTAQVLVLALFPALLFLQANLLHNRLSGLLLAGLITFRETSSIALGGVINTSHAKMLMADLPTALAMAAIGLAVIAWLRGSSRNWVTALLVGGFLGWVILLRSQSLTLVPFFALLAILVWGLRAAWRQVFLFVLGVILVASPWIIRNRILMGQWAIEDAVVAGFIATRYSFDPGTFALPFLPGETEGEYYARHMQQMRDFTLQNPAYVAGFVADNYVRNLLLTVMPLPLSLQQRDLETYVRELPYWPSWDGHLIAETYIPFIGNLFLIGLGIAVAWKRSRWIGLVPLVINLGFTTNLALARVSGWRYNLPADWSVILYYALGLGQLITWLFMALSGSPWARRFVVSLHGKDIVSAGKQVERPHTQQFVAALILLILLGNSFLIIEALSEPRYHELSREETALILDHSVMKQNANSQIKGQLVAMLEEGNLQALSGRALYPRFYRAGEGIPDGEFVLTQPRDFERITFYLIGPNPASVVLRVDSSPLDFPSSSDVIVLRCGSDMAEAVAVMLIDELNSSTLIASSDLELSCPVSGS